MFNLGSFCLKSKSISYHSSSQNYCHQRWATYPESLNVTTSEHSVCLPSIIYPFTHQSSIYLPAYHLSSVSCLLYIYESVICIYLPFYLFTSVIMKRTAGRRFSWASSMLSKISYSISLLNPVKSEVSTPPGQCRIWRLGFSLLDSVIHICFSVYLWNIDTWRSSHCNIYISLNSSYYRYYPLFSRHCQFVRW